MAKYPVIVVRKWASNISTVYDYWYTEVSCEPNELSDRLVETLNAVPRMAPSDGRGNVAVQPQLLQVIPLSIPCGSCNHAQVTA